MCFSASASFIASAGLFSIGILSVKKANTFPLRLFASIPLVFGIQQFCEGWEWLSFHNPTFAGWRNPAMYLFLFFAQVVWPVFVAASVLLLEKQRGRKRILQVLSALGVVTALYFLYCLAAYPVSVSAEASHLKYDLEFPPLFRWISGLFYLLAAVLSPFLSSLKKVRLLGVALLLSYLITRIFYQDFLVSVWCYFAAVLSVFILWVVSQLKKEDAPGYSSMASGIYKT